MITRLWHGWTTPANAPAYENLLRTEIFTGIAARQIAGYRGISLCKREVGTEVEFVTICGSTRSMPCAPLPARITRLRRYHRRRVQCLRGSIRFPRTTRLW